MTNNPESLAEDDPRILQVSREYLAELEAGRSPDRQTYLDRYPELADVLSEYLEGIQLAQSLRLPAAVPSPEHTASPLGDFQIVREVGRGGMGVVYEASQLSLGRYREKLPALRHEAHLHLALFSQYYSYGQ